MLIDKYIICLPKAVKHVCRSQGIAVLRDTDLSVLYAVKRLEVGNISGILSYLRSYGSPIVYSSLCRSLPRLIDAGLIVKDGYRYSLSASGRFFLSRIRNYLLRIRL